MCIHGEHSIQSFQIPSGTERFQVSQHNRKGEEGPVLWGLTLLSGGASVLSSGSGFYLAPLLYCLLDLQGTGGPIFPGCLNCQESHDPHGPKQSLSKPNKARVSTWCPPEVEALPCMIYSSHPALRLLAVKHIFRMLSSGGLLITGASYIRKTLAKKRLK